MIDHKTPDVRQLLKNKSAQISELETLVQNLQTEISEITSDRDRVVIESKLAIEDAELARSFSKKNYASLLTELFEKPSKKLSRLSLMSLLFNGVLIVALSYASLMYVFTKDKQALNEQVIAIQAQIDQLSSTVPTLIQENNRTIKQLITDDQISSKTPIISEIKPSSEKNSTPNTNDIVEVSLDKTINDESAAEAFREATITEEEIKPSVNSVTRSAEDITKDNIVQQQGDALFRYVDGSIGKEGFPNNFANDKTHLAQLYLIIMQHASNEAIYYESYLHALDLLNISSNIAPKNVDDLIVMDKEFLQATFSAFLITSRKQARKWRYREVDRKFSTYYNPEIGYNLGDWQVVNDTADYATLPTIFSLNMQRVIQQLAFNNQTVQLTLPDTIFYQRYDESPKNNALLSLLNSSEITSSEQKNNALAMNSKNISLPVSKKIITDIQRLLTDKKLMAINNTNGISGPKTAKAINSYKKTLSLSNNSTIDLELLNSMNIDILYSDLSI